MNEVKSYGVIYLVTNKTDGKVYVGQTVNFKKRLRQYKYLRCKGQTKLYNALSCHGFENFLFEILDEAIDKTQLDFLEIFYIEKFESLSPLKGYNLLSGGSNGIPCEETRKKMSISRTGKKVGKFSKQAISNMSLCQIGHEVTEETRRKISEKCKGLVRSLETREKISNSKKGQTLTAEHKRKIAESIKGKKHTEEARKNMVEAQRKRFAKP